MLDLYLNGLNRCIVESAGGKTTWEGFIAEMNLTLDGVTYQRSMLDLANVVKVFYTKISGNLFENPSVETDPWPDEGVPDTNEQSTDWAVRGEYSEWCITQGGTNDEGMRVGIINAGDTIPLTAEIAYQCRVSVNVISGVWMLKVKETGADATIAKAKTAGTGEQILIAEITEDNTYETVRVILIEKTSGADGEIYADNAIFCYAPTKAETTWYTDSDSIATYGRIEDTLLEPERTDAEAIGKAQTELANRAYPRSVPPRKMSTGPIRRDESLAIQFCGYVFTLNWMQIRTTNGEHEADTHITSLVNESEFITPGEIDTNAMLCMVDVTYPTRLWDKIKDIVKAGDGSYNRWQGGVYAGRRFDYSQTSQAVTYHYNGGQLLNANYSPVAPWEARPALTCIDNMPTGPGEVTGDATDDPRNVFLEGVEFIAPDRVDIIPPTGREVV